MKVKVNKKVFIGIISVIVIVAIVGVIVGLVVPTIKFTQLKNKLSQINAEELQNKIIQELETTSLYVKGSTTIDNGIKIDNLEDYVIANIMEIASNDIYVVTVPLFKINNSNGNFKSIEYISNFPDLEIDIEDIIFNVLKADYGIDINYSNQQKLMEHNKSSVSIGYSSDKALLWYVSQVSHNDRYSDLDNKSDIMISAYASEIEKDYKTQYFGLDL